jgi:hypothetical protein
MKKLFIMTLIPFNAMALDFDTEWSKFSNDFAKLRATKAQVITIPDTVARVNVVEQVDPKSPHRLGLKLSDPAMRKHLEELYKRPDTVVYSLTLE